MSSSRKSTTRQAHRSQKNLPSAERELRSGSKHRTHPPLWNRIFSVWYRHVRVYSKNLISNGFPPFLEPLIFLAGIGLGLGNYIEQMKGFPYLQFLSSGLLVSTAMFTAAFECSFGTFIRLEFDKVYDGMLSAPITANNLLIGEMLWAGTKGFFFTIPVMIVVSSFRILPVGRVMLAPVVGFLTGTMFAAFSLFVTSFVKTINHFNFYFTGFISPMFFFSGIVFPVDNLPSFIRPLAELLPLTHPVRISRSVCLNTVSLPLFFTDLLYIAVFTFFFGLFAVKRLKRRLIN
ncbi:MAG: ABC transporter [Spirochaetes bacterium]|nr:MAG: ABC transporter [Spirochaetota bacterium]